MQRFGALGPMYVGIATEVLLNRHEEPHIPASHKLGLELAGGGS